MNSVLVLVLCLIAYMGVLLLAILIHDHFRVKKIVRAFEAEDARKAARTPEQVAADMRAACIALCGFDPQLLEVGE